MFPSNLRSQFHRSTIDSEAGPVVMLVLPSWLRWMEALASHTQILYLGRCPGNNRSSDPENLTFIVLNVKLCLHICNIFIYMGHPHIMIIIYIYILYIYILCLDLVFFAVVVMRWDEISAIASLGREGTSIRPVVSCGLPWSTCRGSGAARRSHLSIQWMPWWMPWWIPWWMPFRYLLWYVVIFRCSTYVDIFWPFWSIWSKHVQ